MLWLLIAFIAIILIVLAICSYTFHICFYSPTDRKEDPYSRMGGEQYDAVKDQIIVCTRRMDDTPYEPVSICSFDGLKLSGRYYHNADGAPTVILFHGYRSMALRDCAGGFGLATKMGMNVLAVDQRAHANSEGKVISFGINERRDCLSWIGYVSDRFGKDSPIVLSGLSMGAATVLMVCDLGLPENVVAIMADCPYSSPTQIISKVSEDLHYPSKLAYPFLRLGARLFGNFSLEESSALTAVEHAKIPILLLHGEDDRFVPCQMSRDIYGACPHLAQLHTFPGAGHGLCYMVDPRRYEQITVQFLMSLPSLKGYLQDNEFVQSVSQDVK